MVFSITYYSELHGPTSIYFVFCLFLVQVKMLVLYNVQTTNSTFVGRQEMYNKQL